MAAKYMVFFMDMLCRDCLPGTDQIVVINDLKDSGYANFSFDICKEMMRVSQ